MKYFLLLYPIREYIEVFLGGFPPSVVKRTERQFRTLVRERYRRQGFRIALVFFSSAQDPTYPDVNQKWEGISIHQEDVLVPAGVDFKTHCQKHIYPKESAILSFLQPPIEELVIGGFHFWDCVEKMARYAFKQGIPVSVDEDLTELGMGLRRIPISRKESLRQFVEQVPGYLRELIEDKRKTRPWLLRL